MTIPEAMTPEKYRPANRRCTDREWLYEQYWNKLESIETIASRAEVSATIINRQLDEHGTVRRTRHTPTDDHERLGETLRGKYGCHSIEDYDDSPNWRRD